jgi:ribulose-phosphate 3-epimerase
MIEQMNPGCELNVDGGIDEASVPMAVAAGANVLVAGSSVFGANKTVTAAIEALREAAIQAAP